MPFNQPVVVQGIHMVFDGVATGLCRFNGIVNRYSAMLAGDLKNLYGKGRQFANNNTLALDLAP
jgi:hypothetical protein